MKEQKQVTEILKDFEKHAIDGLVPCGFCGESHIPKREETVERIHKIYQDHIDERTGGMMDGLLRAAKDALEGLYVEHAENCADKDCPYTKTYNDLRSAVEHADQTA